MSVVNTVSSQQAVEIRLTLESPSVRNTIVPYVPGSLNIKLGKGEHIVETLTAGGGETETYRASNEKTKKSMVAFEVINNLKYQTIVANLKFDLEAFSGGATIFYEDVTTGVEVVFRNMVLLNDPEFGSSVDGTVSLEFEGSQALTTI